MGMFFGIAVAYGFVINHSVLDTLLRSRFPWLPRSWVCDDGPVVVVYIPSSLAYPDMRLEQSDLEQGYVDRFEFECMGGNVPDPQGPERQCLDAMAAWCRAVPGPIATESVSSTLGGGFSRPTFGRWPLPILNVPRPICLDAPPSRSTWLVCYIPTRAVPRVVTSPGEMD